MIHVQEKDTVIMKSARPHKNKHIIIWTEGGRKIGMGHIMRSLSIAQAIKKKGLSVSFIVNEDKAAIDTIISSGYPAIVRDALQDYASSIKHCSSFDTVLFDTKRDISEEIQCFKDIGLKVIMIDNGTPAARASDLVIIPSLKETSRSETTLQNLRLLEGLKYFPLNHKFIEIRDFCTKTPDPKLRILVTMGGADPNNLTLKVVKALQAIEGIEVRTVIGPSMEIIEDLEELDNGNFINNVDVKKMALLMRDSDIAFTSFGITLFELAYMGVPSVVIANYLEDKEDMTAFNKIGVGIALGFHEDVEDIDIKKAVESFLHKRELLKGMSKTGRMLVDGNGAIRIVNAIETVGNNIACNKQELVKG